MKLILTATNLLEYMEGENGFKLLLTTPSQKTIVLGASCDVQLEGTTTKVVSVIEYKNMENKEYKYTSVIALEKLGGPYNYVVKAKVIYKQPETQEIMLETEVKHQWTPEEHLVAFKVCKIKCHYTYQVNPLHIIKFPFIQI